MLTERRASITWADTIQPEPVEWSWMGGRSGPYPVRLAVDLRREGGTGKSSGGLSLAAQVSRGTLPGALFGTPRRVLIVAVADSWRFTLVLRLLAAGADLGMVGRFGVLDCGDEP